MALLAREIKLKSIFENFEYLIDRHHALSYFAASCLTTSCFGYTPAFCLFVYYFFISFNLCRHFWAIAKVLAESFFVLKLKSVRVYLFACFFPLSKITSLSYCAHSFPSASIFSRTGMKASSNSWTTLRLAVSLRIFAS
jgi:hypothetical protein